MAEKKKVGRPKIEIDLDELEKLGALQCTDEELAAWFDCSTKTIERRRKEDPEFCRALEKGRARGRMSLRRWQFRGAENGNATMLVWLGKNHLGQTDKMETKAEVQQESRVHVEFVMPPKPEPEGDG